MPQPEESKRSVCVCVGGWGVGGQSSLHAIKESILFFFLNALFDFFRFEAVKGRIQIEAHTHTHTHAHAHTHTHTHTHTHIAHTSHTHTL